jgi:hypothetical protein
VALTPSLTLSRRFNVPKSKPIELGDRVRDTISGFSGVAVGRTIWLHGCERLGIAPTELDKDGKPRPVEWFDIFQVERIAESTITRGTIGGPTPNPTRNADPR